ncbi:MAG: helix-turn-helix domain-containing protein [Candidatus Thiodiazotropha sp. (ex Dulcina madagascariensis)]|nr:helix-turn-helix domain-containing protein [Candidatus Thiodiazotropha sp. (ex Epidulcina cf. delphinae)]MCU7921611.1 helix-turn-helix domain-containing protein [Candidatus Thiodiazotropha sp. (ex Dulcina madagascariensis)]MCU7928573.1 helix-turn-helix domain-containing protein [Candidatus Thiodiazotropha sp. (ex Dulcina madagascariensis)]
MVDVLKLRSRLGLSQAQFGNLFGVHPMTVSKWERDILKPTPYQIALMTEFEKSARSKEVRDTIGSVLIGAGIAAALFLLLKHSQNK